MAKPLLRARFGRPRLLGALSRDRGSNFRPSICSSNAVPAAREFSSSPSPPEISNSASASPPPPATTTRIPSNAVIFSGIQPTGTPHLGNYLGALRQWVRLQDSASPGTKLLYSIVDLHAITVAQRGGGGAEAMRRQRRHTLAALLAIGLDPDRSVLFYQSSVPAHSELMWILSCTASVGYLSRMTQWKTKMSVDEKKDFIDDKVKAKLKLGLFSYPVLQAADVLVHGATHVPVGEDQRQHLEFARECATNFNATYGQQVLVAPETVHSPAKRVMSLTNPSDKMSKSAADDRSLIYLTDTPEVVRKKISTALTDSNPTVTYDPVARPAVANLLEMFGEFDPEGRTPAELASSLGGFGGGNIPMKNLKQGLAAAINTALDGIGDRYREVLARRDGAYIDDVAELGAEAARASAAKTMDAVHAAVGFA